MSTYAWDIRLPGVAGMDEEEVQAAKRHFRQTLLGLLLAKGNESLSLNEVRALFARKCSVLGRPSSLSCRGCMRECKESLTSLEALHGMQ